MSGKSKNPMEPKAADLQPRQQMADDGGLDDGESFANIEPSDGQSFANINPVDE